jgi:hypothetical protein
VWWFTSAIPVLGRLRQENQELQASLGYLERLSPKSKNKQKNKKIQERNIF